MGCIMRFRSPDLYTIIIVTKIKKGFLKKKERVKDFFIFFSFYFVVSLFTYYDLSKLNQTTVRNSHTNEVVVGLLSFLIVRILDILNMALLFFQFELKMAVHTARTKRKFLKGTTSDTSLKKVNFIFVIFQEELASLLSTGKPFSRDLQG